MAANLREKGHDLLVFNRTKEKTSADTAYETGVALPLENAVKELLAVRKGLGDRDFSAVYTMLSEPR